MAFFPQTISAGKSAFGVSIWDQVNQVLLSFFYQFYIVLWSLSCILKLQRDIAQIFWPICGWLSGVWLTSSGWLRPQLVAEEGGGGGGGALRAAQISSICARLSHACSLSSYPRISSLFKSIRNKHLLSLAQNHLQIFVKTKYIWPWAPIWISLSHGETFCRLNSYCWKNKKTQYQLMKSLAMQEAWTASQIYNQCKWCHLVVKIGTDADCTIWWPTKLVSLSKIRQGFNCFSLLPLCLWQCFFLFLVQAIGNYVSTYAKPVSHLICTINQLVFSRPHLLLPTEQVLWLDSTIDLVRLSSPNI